MEIILVRHAQTDANVHNLFVGKQESPLTELGRQQAKLLSRHLAKLLNNVDAVYSSPQSRAQETADQISQDLLLNEVITDDRLKEINLGDWEGLSSDAIRQQFPEVLSAWETNPESAIIPAAETLPQVVARARDFCLDSIHEGQTRIVVVSHAITIRCLLTSVLQRPLIDLWMYEIDTAGYSIVDWDKPLPTVVQINHIEHLVDE